MDWNLGKFYGNFWICGNKSMKKPFFIPLTKGSQTSDLVQFGSLSAGWSIFALIINYGGAFWVEMDEESALGGILS